LLEKAYLLHDCAEEEKNRVIKTEQNRVGLNISANSMKNQPEINPKYGIGKDPEYDDQLRTKGIGKNRAKSILQDSFYFPEPLFWFEK
jgi:hypothetical protein